MTPHINMSLSLPCPISLKSVNISWSEDFLKIKGLQERGREGEREEERKGERKRRREGGRRERERQRYPDLFLDRNKSDLGVESTVYIYTHH